MGLVEAPAEPKSLAVRGADKGAISIQRVAQTQPKQLAELEAREAHQVQKGLYREEGETLQDRSQQPRGSAASPSWVKEKTREDRSQQPQMLQQAEIPSRVAMLITLNYRHPVTLNRTQTDAIKHAEAKLGTELRQQTETKNPEPAE